jgi:hypothetical protein
MNGHVGDYGRHLVAQTTTSNTTISLTPKGIEMFGAKTVWSYLKLKLVHISTKLILRIKSVKLLLLNCKLKSDKLVHYGLKFVNFQEKTNLEATYILYLVATPRSASRPDRGGCP